MAGPMMLPPVSLAMAKVTQPAAVAAPGPALLPELAAGVQPRQSTRSRGPAIGPALTASGNTLRIAMPIISTCFGIVIRMYYPWRHRC
jgi:hypothetical protein